MISGDLWVVIIVAATVAIFLNLFGAYLMSEAAKEKGYDSNAHVMAACFFLGIIGYLYALCLPDKILQQQNDTMIQLQNQLLVYQNNMMQNPMAGQRMPAQRSSLPSNDLPDL